VLFYVLSCKPLVIFANVTLMTNSHLRRDSTQQFSRVGVVHVNWP